MPAPRFLYMRAAQLLSQAAKQAYRRAALHLRPLVIQAVQPVECGHFLRVTVKHDGPFRHGVVSSCIFAKLLTRVKTKLFRAREVGGGSQLKSARRVDGAVDNSPRPYL